MRRGTTLIEALVASLLAMLLLAMVGELCRAAQQGSAAASESADALRSAQLALEAIRTDLLHMFYQEPDRDLDVLDSGRGLMLNLVTPVTGDPWQVDTAAVYWTIDAIPGTSRVFALVRDDGKTRRTLSGCLLADLVVRGVARSGDSKSPTHLEILAIGAGSLDARRTHTATILVPLPRVVRPAAVAEGAP